ncbi:hypothetical protein ARMSODRAFT_85051 [Armillaria solidipes]|uniref:Uncharacterized protein n=1 Tax=Armillaria solidipes TaxID=1076256 RepID=A0A2H3AIT6_9AGAR|nr:hypothetical protein ARMSODRAFT_85051 [Armillaria solidipes]
MDVHASPASWCTRHICQDTRRDPGLMCRVPCMTRHLPWLGNAPATRPILLTLIFFLLLLFFLVFLPVREPA